MTKHIVSETSVELVAVECPVCNGTCTKHKTFCFKCNGRGFVQRPRMEYQVNQGALLELVQEPDASDLEGILEDLAAIQDYLTAGGTVPSARVYFSNEDVA